MNSAISDHQTQVRIRAFAPGGIGNIGPGLDILGCALTGPGDSIEVRFGDTSSIWVEEPGHPDIPRDASRHTSALAAGEVLRIAGRTDVGLVLRVEKGLPLAGGQGGSAASAVAGALATNALLGRPLDDRAVARAALSAEERVSGRHADNVAPALFGGIVLIRRADPLDFVRLPVPPWLRFAVAQPNLTLPTHTARALLPDRVDRSTAIAQMAAVGSMIAAFCLSDPELLRGSVEDRIAEPARASLIPGFHDVKRAALDAGALGCSISGAGPSVFAIVDGDAAAHAALEAMLKSFTSAGVEASGRVASVDERGARILESA